MQILLALQQLKREQARKCHSKRTFWENRRKRQQLRRSKHSTLQMPGIAAADGRKGRGKATTEVAEGALRDRPDQPLRLASGHHQAGAPLPAHWYAQRTQTRLTVVVWIMPPPPLMLLPRMPSDGKTPERVRIDLGWRQGGKDKAKRARQRINKANLVANVAGGPDAAARHSASASRMEDRLKTAHTTMPKLATPSVVLQLCSGLRRLHIFSLHGCAASSASRRDKPMVLSI